MWLTLEIYKKNVIGVKFVEIILIIFHPILKLKAQKYSKINQHGLNHSTFDFSFEFEYYFLILSI